MSETWETQDRSLSVAVLGGSVSFGDTVVPPEAQAGCFSLQTVAYSWRRLVHFCLLKEVTVLGFSVPLADGVSHPHPLTQLASTEWALSEAWAAAPRTLAGESAPKGSLPHFSSR